HRVTEGVVAAAPVAAVLISFSLLLTLLRQSKTHTPAPGAAETIEVPALAAAAAPPIALPAAPVDIETAPTEAVPVLAGGPVPDVAPTREDPVIADAPEPATAASESAAPSVDEPAPPTVVVPALAPEP